MKDSRPQYEPESIREGSGGVSILGICLVLYVLSCLMKLIIP